MRFPWANIALIVLVAAELATGYLGLTHNNPEWIAAMHLHRIFGFAILALFIWKSRNILGSLKSGYNWRRSGREMLWSLILLAGLLIVLGLGLAWSHLGSYYWLGFSGTTIHMNLAWMLIPLLLWHSLRHRISFRTRYLADRRNLLRVGGLALAGLMLWRTAELAGILSDGPGARRRYTGSYPEDGPDFPVTMWLNDKVPYVDAASWRLRVDGHVERPFEMDIAEFQEWQDGPDGHAGLHGRLAYDAGVGGHSRRRVAGPRSTQSRGRPASPYARARATSGAIRWQKLSGRSWRAGWMERRCRRGTGSRRAWWSRTSGAMTG